MIHAHICYHFSFFATIQALLMGAMMWEDDPQVRPLFVAFLVALGTLFLCLIAIVRRRDANATKNNMLAGKTRMLELCKQRGV